MSDDVRTVAHRIPVTQQMMDDACNLRAALERHAHLVEFVSERREWGWGWPSVAASLQNFGYKASDLRSRSAPEGWDTIHASLVRRWAKRNGIS